MSTSRLQQYVKNELKKCHKQFVENYHPSWLTDNKGNRLELDFYLENLKIAIEVQGEQHVLYTPFFHKSPENFRLQLKRDQIKREICQARGIHLIEITTKEQVRPAILQILDIEHKPEALEKILRHNRYLEAVNNLPPVEKCIWHAMEIKRHQNYIAELSRKKNIKETTLKAIKKTASQIRQHKRLIIKLAKNDEATQQVAMYLLEQLFKH